MLTELLRSVDAATLPTYVRAAGAVPWSEPPARPPIADRSRPFSQQLYALRDLTKDVPCAGPGWRRQCANYYPAGGGIGWHTDSAWPGWRVYVYRLLGADGASVMRFDDQEFHEGPSEFGGYVFKAGIWHALYTHIPRLSCGFQIPATFASELIASCAV